MYHRIGHAFLVGRVYSLLQKLLLTIKVFKSCLHLNIFSSYKEKKYARSYDLLTLVNLNLVDKRHIFVNKAANPRNNCLLQKWSKLTPNRNLIWRFTIFPYSIFPIFLHFLCFIILKSYFSKKMKLPIKLFSVWEKGRKKVWDVLWHLEVKFFPPMLMSSFFLFHSLLTPKIISFFVKKKTLFEQKKFQMEVDAIFLLGITVCKRDLDQP